MKIDAEKLDFQIADKGMLLKDVAKASGISQNALRAIRTGQSEARIATIGKIAKAIGVGVHEIIVDERE